ncbi:TylF/MycF family methyltransferase [Streptomyces purpurogeneiscleroticus]|uniref:TylF/MycF family methyltransferase n=1 Tax=Streptomyces purpurogeneiscleroticus TaxID=68259 RepID=UPI001CBFCBD3|nr:TylF/MycF family methyltransferase [Streptomyces purpurogeneiscleroticus]
MVALHERLGLRPPEVHGGWFEDTLPSSLPERIASCYSCRPAGTISAARRR